MITISPTDMFLYGAILAWMMAAVGLALWVKRKDWAGAPAVFLAAVGMMFIVIAGELRDEARFQVKLDELPVEWRQFYDEASNVHSSLQSKAVEKFMDTEPSKITTDQYSTLLSSYEFFDCASVHEFVILDFAERKNPPPETP